MMNNQLWSNLRMVFSRRKKKDSRSVDIETVAELLEWSYWIERSHLRLMVPAEMLRMQGGFIYGKSHPFVQALTHGSHALKEFYHNVQPTSLSDYYGIKPCNRIGYDLPPWEIPWYKRSLRTPPSSEKGLGVEHGVSFYGPATQQKISVELERLHKIVESIRQNGYVPEKYGDIEGYILKDGVDACFFVRGGKHRAAALTFLGYKKIPVAFRRTFPLVVDGDSAAYWPLVRTGLIDINLARELLNIYVKGRELNFVSLNTKNQ